MIYGNFKSISGIDYTVNILCDVDCEIGSEDKDIKIYFTEDPVTISHEVDDTFETIIKTTCDINLLTNTYLGDYLFSANDREIKVNVLKDGECIFSGYVEPLSFSQDFADEFVEIELTCVDWLSTLENHKYKEWENYEDVKLNAKNIEFSKIICNMLNTGGSIWYCGSSVGAAYQNLMTNYGISETLLLGDEEDDLWTQEEVLNEILQYYNYHIIQKGEDFYIFPYEFIKYEKSSGATFVDLKGKADDIDILPKDIVVTKDMYKDSDTNISMSDVYNKITIECDLQEVEDVFESPLEDDSLVSPFTYRLGYLREIDPKQDNAKWRQWYFQYLTNDNWTFRWINPSTLRVHDYQEILNKYCIVNKEDGTVDYQKQWRMLLNSTTTNSAFLGKFGYYEANSKDDHTKKNDLSLDPCIVIPVNGSENKDNNRGAYFAQQMDAYEKAGGMVEYKSKQSAGILSPVDNDATNYIVFSGKFVMQPKGHRVPIIFPEIRYDEAWQRVFYSDEDGKSMDNWKVTNSVLLRPYLKYTDGWQNQYGEEYGEWLVYGSETGEDKISKIPVLVCQLKIGDKYACEVDIDEYEWHTQQEIDDYNTTVSEDAAMTNTFTLGFDPKIGDKFLCTEWDFNNTFTPDMGVEDAEGTGIPIKASDKLCGQVEFRILGIYYYNYSQTIRQHPTAFRHVKFWTTDLPIMEFVKELYITDFECKIYTDNGVTNTGVNLDNDLIYTSDENDNSIQAKDDITFKFNTALTTQEAIEKGVPTITKISNVINIPTNTPLFTIWESYTNEEAKPEELYINSMYNEYSKPKIILETTLDTNKTDYFGRYTFSYFPNKEFITLSSEKNLKYDTNTLTIKEI